MRGMSCSTPSHAAAAEAAGQALHRQRAVAWTRWLELEHMPWSPGLFEQGGEETCRSWLYML